MIGEIDKPKSTGAVIKQIGEEYHIVKLKGKGVYLVEVNADYWKSWVHERLRTPLGSPGAMTFYHAMPKKHISVSRYLTAERRIQTYDAKKGKLLEVWKRERRSNHWLDALYIACAAGHLCGARLEDEEAEPLLETPPEPRRRMGITTPDGRPFL